MENTAKIRDKLQELFPGHQPIVYVYAAAKVDAAMDMAKKKVADRGLTIEDLPPETINSMVDWSIRLAFGAHTESADKKFFADALGGVS